MKNAPLLLSFSILCGILFACKKSSGGNPNVQPKSTFSFVAGDSAISYPINLVYIQDVTTTHTTLISGQYQDSSSKKGSLSFRLLSDTTGRFQGDSLLVTYTDGKGSVYYNTGDPANYVQVDKFPKTYNGVVTGSFNVKVAGNTGSIQLTRGSFIAIYQY